MTRLALRVDRGAPRHQIPDATLSLLGTADKGAYGSRIVKGSDLALMGRAWTCLAVLVFCASLVGEDAAALWPRQIDTPQGRCLVFQPQPAALDGERLSARAAVAVTPVESTNVVFGIAQLQARASQDPSGKEIAISEVALTQLSFAPANAPAMTGLADTLRPELAKVTWTVASDTLKAGLDAIEGQRAAAQGLSARPPRILYSSTPAALVVLDGSPQLRQITNSTLMRVVNTPYAMLFEPAGPRYWLRGAYEWFSAADWRGEWVPTAQPPSEVAAALPAETAAEAPALGRVTEVSPRILISTEPAELIVTQGEAAYAPVAGSELLYVSNSDQLLFFTLDTKEYYVALSGRWYRSAALTGPWDGVAAGALPPAFAKIKPGSPKSEALTYVAGTVEAQDAVAQASIPQITAVERGPADVEVEYDGTAQFKPVEGTTVQYATNTADAVFLVGGNYYMCREAVWYTGAGPEGPWSVAAFVPPEIQSLPPSNPHYNVKYVYVYGATPQEVYVGYEPGYSGCYVYGPTVVYGTGWWYPGYYSPSYCWAYPATFGFGFGYNSWSGWSVGFGWNYGWLGCGYGWGWGGYYPWGWWGPRGAYWACAPRYRHYDGYHDGYHHGQGGHGDRGYGRFVCRTARTRWRARQRRPTAWTGSWRRARRAPPGRSWSVGSSNQPATSNPAHLRADGKSPFAALDRTETCARHRTAIRGRQPADPHDDAHAANTHEGGRGEWADGFCAAQRARERSFAQFVRIVRAAEVNRRHGECGIAGERNAAGPGAGSSIVERAGPFWADSGQVGWTQPSRTCACGSAIDFSGQSIDAGTFSERSGEQLAGRADECGRHSVAERDGPCSKPRYRLPGRFGVQPVARVDSNAVMVRWDVQLRVFGAPVCWALAFVGVRARVQSGLRVLGNARLRIGEPCSGDARSFGAPVREYGRQCAAQLQCAESWWLFPGLQCANAVVWRFFRRFHEPWRALAGPMSLA